MSQQGVHVFSLGEPSIEYPHPEYTYAWNNRKENIRQYALSFEN